MAVLTQADIIAYMQAGRLAFSPALDVFQMQAHAIDLRLGFTFLVPRAWHVTEAGREQLYIDYYAPNPKHEHYEVVELKPGQYFDLLPGEHILVSSLESLSMADDIMAVMYPRTSTNRKGLSVDQTGIIDSGYKGTLIIPVRNNTRHQTVRLYPGERFCQLVFEQLTRPVTARKSRYHLRDIKKGVDVDKLKNERQSEIAYLQSGEIEKLKKQFTVR